MPAEPPLKYYMPLSRTQVANLVCSNCFVGSAEPLRKCTKCRRVGYCNQACQLQDWAEHKGICKQLQKVNEYEMKKGHTLSDPSRRLEYYVSEEVSLSESVTPSTDPLPWKHIPSLTYTDRKPDAKSSGRPPAVHLLVRTAVLIN